MKHVSFFVISKNSAADFDRETESFQGMLYSLYTLLPVIARNCSATVASGDVVRRDSSDHCTFAPAMSSMTLTIAEAFFLSFCCTQKPDNRPSGDFSQFPVP